MFPFYGFGLLQAMRSAFLRGFRRHRGPVDRSQSHVDLACEPLEPRLVLATFVWTGAGDGTTWSDESNWINQDAGPMISGAPTAGDTAILDDVSNGNTTITVDPGRTIGTLRVGDVDADTITHAFTLQGAGLTVTTLTQTGSSLTTQALFAATTLNLQVGNFTATAGLQANTVNIAVSTGSAATASLVVQGGDVDIGTGGEDFNIARRTVNNSSTVIGTADFSAASSVDIRVNNLRVGTITSGSGGTATGTLRLSQVGESTIAASSIFVGDSTAAGNTGVTNRLYLGIDNTITASTLVVGGNKSVGELLFQSAGSTLELGSSSSRVGEFAIGRSTVGTAGGGTGVVNWNGNTVTAYINNLNFGGKPNDATGTTQGTLSFDTGLIDANTVRLGFRTNGGSNGTTRGTLNQSGGTLRFGTLQTVGGVPVYTWTGGTIGNRAGSNATSAGIVLLPSGTNPANPHTFDVTAGQTLTVPSLSAESAGNSVIRKIGDGTLIPGGNVTLETFVMERGFIDLNGNLDLTAGQTVTFFLGDSDPGNPATIPGFDHGQIRRLNTTSTVNLNNAVFAIQLQPGFIGLAGQEFVLISNPSGGSGIIGQFNGLAEGQLLTVDGNGFRISYIGGQVRLIAEGQPGPTISLDGSGNLIIQEPGNGLNNQVTIYLDGTDLVITDPGLALTSTVPGSTQPNPSTIRVPLASFTGEIRVNTLGGTDRLRVDYATGGFFGNSIVFDGGTPTTGPGDSLEIVGGNFSTVTSNHTNGSTGSISLQASGGGSATISYTGLEPVLINAGSIGEMVFNLTSNHDNAVLEYDSNGVSRLRSANGAFEVTSFTNPTISLTINGGAGNDTITVAADLDSGNGANQFNASLVINGDAGTDIVIVQSDLILGSATSAGDLTLTAEDIRLSGDINTIGNADAGNVTFNGRVYQAASFSIVTDGVNSDGNIQFNGDLLTVNPADAALTLNAGADGNISVTGRIGGVTYTETNGDGQIVIEADHYALRHINPTSGWVWKVQDETIPADSVVPLASATGNRYMIFAPDYTGSSVPGGAGIPERSDLHGIYYQVLITTPGLYRLFHRSTADAPGPNADSLFIDILDVEDGSGGPISDWYVTPTATADQTFSGFQGSGTSESTASPGTGTAITWDLTPGLYTIRIAPREDGAAVDKLVFQRTGSAPTGTGPNETPNVGPQLTIVNVNNMTVSGTTDAQSIRQIRNSGLTTFNGNVTTDDFFIERGNVTINADLTITGETRVGYSQGDGAGTAIVNVVGGDVVIGDGHEILDIGHRQAGSGVVLGTLDLSAATSVTIDVAEIRIGRNNNVTSDTVRGDLLLSSTGMNQITADTMTLGFIAGSPTGSTTGVVTLGQDNTMNVDTLIVGGDKSLGTISFATSGTLTLGGNNGAATNLRIGDNDGGNTSSQPTQSHFNMSAGVFNATLGTVDIGRYLGTGTGRGNGLLTMSAGTVTMDTLALAVTNGSNPQNTIGGVTLNGGSITVANGVSRGAGASSLIVDHGTFTVIDGGLAVNTLRVGLGNNFSADATLRVQGGAVDIGTGTSSLLVARRTTNNTNTTVALVDFTGASSVNMAFTEIRVGETTQNGQPATGQILLSSTGTNTITTGQIVLARATNVFNEALPGSLIQFGGGVNNVHVDTFIVGAERSTATVTLLAGGTLNLNGQAGAATTTDLYIAHNVAGTSSNISGVFDASAGTLNANLGQLRIGRHNSGSGSAKGTFSFSDGLVSVATIDMARPDASGSSSNDAQTQGTLNMAGGTLLFETLVKGNGVATFNWSGGTISHRVGLDATDTNVVITVLATSGTAPQTFEVETDRIVTIASLNVTEARDNAIIKSGGGILRIATATTLESLQLDGGFVEVNGNLTWTSGTTLAVTLDDTDIGNPNPIPGADFGQVIVNAPATVVQLNNANLNLQLAGGFIPTAGQEFILIDNTSPGTTVSGTFAGRPEGAVVTIGNEIFTISYIGGDGNDVVLRAEGTAETSVTLDGSGNLVITDINGGVSTDELTIYLDGGELVITDPNLVLTTSVPGASQPDVHTIRVPLGAFSGAILVNTLGGNDTLTLDYGTGGYFARPITFNGGNPTTPVGDILRVLGGEFASITVNHTDLENASVVLAPSGGGTSTTITLNGHEAIDLSANTIETLTFNLTSTHDFATLEDDGIAGNNRSRLVSTNSRFEPTTFVNPLQSLIINAGAGNDYLTIAPSFETGAAATQFNAALSVDGGIGTDIIAVNADLALGSSVATGNLLLTSEDIRLNGNISTIGNATAGNVTFNGRVFQVSSLSITTDGSGSDGHIQINGDLYTVDPANANLSFDAGSDGSIGITGSIGGVTYQESGGVVVMEANQYTDRSIDPLAGWVWKINSEVLTNEGIVAISGAADGAYMIHAPDYTSTGGQPSGSSTLPASDTGAIYFRVVITTAGIYRLFHRSAADLPSGNSDSLYADIVEIKNGVSGTGPADWYVTPTASGNQTFGSFQGSGARESTASPGTGNQLTWDLTPGIYTIRFVAREDGAALDKLVLQLATATAPSGNGPAVTAAAGPNITIVNAHDVTVGGTTNAQSIHQITITGVTTFQNDVTTTGDFFIDDGSVVINGDLTVRGNARVGATVVAGTLPSNADVTVNGGAVVIGSGSGTLDVGLRTVAPSNTNATTGVLNLANATSVVIQVDQVAIGRMVNDPGNEGATRGDLILSTTGTNSINAGTILVSDSPTRGNTGVSTLQLGTGSNTIEVDQFTIGGRKGSGSVILGAGGTLNLTGRAGVGSTANLDLGLNVTGSTGTASIGTFDMSGGTINAALGALRLGRHTAGGGQGRGVFLMDAGTVTVDTIEFALGTANSSGLLHQRGGSITVANGITETDDSTLWIDNGVFVVQAGGMSIDTLRVAYSDNAPAVASLTVQAGDVRIGTGTQDLQIGRREADNNNTATGTVDFAGASSVTIDVDELQIGTVLNGAGGLVIGHLTLSAAGTNTITADEILISDSIATGNTGGGGSTLTFGGGTNTVNTDSFTVAGRKGRATVTMVGGGVLNLAGKSGPRSDLFIGENVIDTAENAVGLMDLSGGTFNAQLDRLHLGRHEQGAGSGTGTLIFDAGTIDLNTGVLGQASLSGATASTTPTNSSGTVTMNGGSFTVNASLTLGLNGAAGFLTANDGTVSIGSGASSNLFVGRRTQNINSGSTTVVSILDVRGATNFTTNVGTFGIGTVSGGGSGQTRGGGRVLLADNNQITATNLVLADSPSVGLAGFTNELLLGASNTILATNVVVGGDKGTGRMAFQAPGGTLDLGTSANRVNLFIGQQEVGTGGGAGGTVDWTGGTVTAFLNQLVIGSKPNNATGGTQGSLTWDAGTIDANQITLGLRTDAGTAGSVSGTMNQNGGTLLFATMTAGGGTATYNWLGGTIGHQSGQNAINDDVIIRLIADDPTDPRIIDASIGQTVTLFALDVSDSGDNSFQKIGAGTLAILSATTLESVDLVAGFVDVGGDFVLSAGTTFSVTLNDTDLGNPTPVPGEDYPQVIVDPSATTVALNNATLEVLLAPGFVSNVGDVFVLVNNQSGQPITGLFLGSNGLPLLDGATVTVGGQPFVIDYNYDAATGTPNAGNDIALIATDAPVLQGTADDDEFRIYRDGTQVVVMLATGGGPEVEVLRRDLTQISAIGIEALAGNDRLTVDYATGDPLPNIAVDFDGMADDDTLQLINGSVGSVAYMLSDIGGSITVDALGTGTELATIQFEGLEESRPIQDLLTIAANGTRTFTLITSGETVSLSDPTASDGLTRLDSDASAAWSIDFTYAPNISIELTGAGSTLAINGVDDTFADNVEFTAPSIQLNNGGLSTSGTQFYRGPVILGADTTLIGSQITFAGRVNSDATARSLNLQSAGDLNFYADVGTLAALASITTDAGGRTQFLHDLGIVVDDTPGGGDRQVVTIGDQTYNDELVIDAPTIFTTQTGQIIVLGGLTAVGSTGDVIVQGNLLLRSPLTNIRSLLVLGAASLDTPLVETIGDQTYQGAVTLAQDISINAGGTVQFGSTVDSDANEVNDLVITASGLILGGNVGTGTNGILGELTVSLMTALNVAVEVLTQGAINLTIADSASVGENLALSAGGSITSQTADVAISVGDNINLAAGSRIEAGANIILLADLGNTDLGVGAVVQLDGELISNAGTVSLTTGEDADSVRYNDVRSGSATVLINTAGGNDFVQIAGTPTGGNVNVSTGIGNDSVLLGSLLQSLDTVRIALTVDGGDGDDNVTLDDQGDNSGNSYFINGSTVDRNNTGLPLLTHSAIESLNLLAGAGADSVSVESTAASLNTLINAGDGNDLISLGGDSALLNFIAGGLSVDGGNGSDALIANDSGDTSNNTGLLTANELSGLGLGGVVSYQAVESLNLTLGSGADWLKLTSTAAGADVLIDLGLGDDTLAFGQDNLGPIAASVNDLGGSDTLDFGQSLATTIDMDATNFQTLNARGDAVRMLSVYENFAGSPFDDTISIDPLAGIARRVEGRSPMAVGSPDLDGNFLSGDTLIFDTFANSFALSRLGTDGVMTVNNGKGGAVFAPVEFTSIERLTIQNQVDLRGLPENTPPADVPPIGDLFRIPRDTFADGSRVIAGLRNDDGDLFRSRGQDSSGREAQVVLIFGRITNDVFTPVGRPVQGASLSEAVEALEDQSLPAGSYELKLVVGNQEVTIPVKKPEDGAFGSEQIEEIEDELEAAAEEAGLELPSDEEPANDDEASADTAAAAALAILAGLGLKTAARQRKEGHWGDEVERLMQRLSDN